MKQLIVNADDFGLTKRVSEGIVDAHRHGIVSSTTLMANGGAFEAAVALRRQAPHLGIGAHLNLSEGDTGLACTQDSQSPRWPRKTVFDSGSAVEGHCHPTGQSGRCRKRAPGANRKDSPRRHCADAPRRAQARARSARCFGHRHSPGPGVFHSQRALPAGGASRNSSTCWSPMTDQPRRDPQAVPRRTWRLRLRPALQAKTGRGRAALSRPLLRPQPHGLPRYPRDSRTCWADCRKARAS